MMRSKLLQLLVIPFLLILSGCSELELPDCINNPDRAVLSAHLEYPAQKYISDIEIEKGIDINGIKIYRKDRIRDRIIIDIDEPFSEIMLKFSAKPSCGDIPCCNKESYLNKISIYENGNKSKLVVESVDEAILKVERDNNNEYKRYSVEASVQKRGHEWIDNKSILINFL